MRVSRGTFATPQGNVLCLDKVSLCSVCGFGTGPGSEVVSLGRVVEETQVRGSKETFPDLQLSKKALEFLCDGFGGEGGQSVRENLCKMFGTCS